MKITKYVHSCLLVESGGKTVLVDPGGFSWDSHMLPVGKLENLDFIVITHEHPDHYHLPFLRALTERFAHATVVTNNELSHKIQAEGIKNQIITGSQDSLEVFEAPHEPLPMDLPAPLNIGVHIDGKLTHPGDAVRINHSREILALPITAPFISFKESLQQVVKIKPKTVLPIHDWHWHKVARQQMYDFAAELLSPHGIKFVALENAEPVEL